MATSKKTSPSRVFKVTFLNQGKVYEIYARNVGQGALFGFVEVEELLFGERSRVVVDPSEESLKIEFAGVKRFHVPMHSVIRIDEVEKEGSARIVQTGRKEDNLTPFPIPLYTPGGGTEKK